MKWRKSSVSLPLVIFQSPSVRNSGIPGRVDPLLITNLLMDFCSYNVRGLNNKKSFYKDFINVKNLSLFAFLETHVKKESANSIASFLSQKFNWSFNSDYHDNGRIWLGWDPSIWKVMPLASSSQHISFSVTRMDTQESFFLSFVYALNTYIERRALWTDLLSFKASISINNVSRPWCLLGDFNVCLNLRDISGSSSIWTTGMTDFKDFVFEAGIVDLNYTGAFFSWWDSNINSRVRKKLDRVLINDSWMSMFPLSRAWFPPRGLSDHCPAMVTTGVQRIRLRKPFQVSNHILNSPDFIATVKDAWALEVSGDPWFRLTHKLKNAKKSLIALNRSGGDLHAKVVSARDTLLHFQNSLPVNPNRDQFMEESRLCNELECCLNQEEMYLRQKSRIQWLHLGEGNNKFFFNACKSRWNSNKILSIEDDFDVTHTEHKSISKIAVYYYQSLLGTSRTVTPLDENVELPLLNDTQRNILEAPFTALDVLKILKSMAKNRSPGPDGFSAEFYLAAWDIVGSDVVSGILHFFHSNELPRIINANGVALIPKIDCPVNMSHFRPISCCNTLYKCIAKLLAIRMKSLLPHLISKNQSAFIPNRSIGDNILLAQALVKDYHSPGPSRCAIKLDIKKAFDTLSWDFLFEVMKRMAFPDRFIGWVKQCVTSSMISLKINGSLEGFFSSKSGLRQGCPLSPYLFVIAMQVLTCYLTQDLENDVNFNYHWRTKEIKLSHLIFAGDLFLFCRGDRYSISAILASVHRFSAASGLFPNPLKSQCFFSNVNTEIIDSTIQRSGFQIGTFPIKYLGLPLISSRLKKEDCIPLV